jgi:hypothetical protein
MLVNWNKKKIGTLLTALVAIIVISPLDDIAVATVFGGALLGFGSVSFYVLMACSSIVSVAFWMRRKHVKQALSDNKNSLSKLTLLKRMKG